MNFTEISAILKLLVLSDCVGELQSWILDLHRIQIRNPTKYPHPQLIKANELFFRAFTDLSLCTVEVLLIISIGLLGKAAKKGIFLSGPATKALPTPPSLELSGHNIFRIFFRASKKDIFYGRATKKKDLYCGFPK